MLCRQYKAMIEVKGRGRCKLRNSGGNAKETQKEQVFRYLDEFQEQDALDLFLDKTIPWRGFLTDGKIWYGWETRNRGYPQPIQGINWPVKPESPDEFLNFITKAIFPSGRQGKPPPSWNLAEDIKTHAETIRTLGEQYQSFSFYTTKLETWKGALGHAGLLDPKDSSLEYDASLFARHTALIWTSKIIIEILHGNRQVTDREILKTSLGQGFSAWLVEKEDGLEILTRMAQEISSYDWKGSSKDALKEIYHLLIDASERREFGEYYTPDWLAQKVVAETLDKPWLDRAIPQAADPEHSGEGISVLDPACGSGTFLMHSAERILTRIREKHPELGPKAREICLRMICGMDIHPIAVEMARATLETALPLPESEQDHELKPRVFLGDAMQMDLKDEESLFEKTVRIISPRRQILDVPRKLLVHRDSHAMIQELEDSAQEKRRPVLPGLDPETLDLAEKASTSLAKIIEKESNHIWAWRMRNLAGPMRLTDFKAGRIVTNPPWIVANNMNQGTRKKEVGKIRKRYGLTANARGSSAKGDLASIFSARCAGLYLPPPNSTPPPPPPQEEWVLCFPAPP